MKTIVLAEICDPEGQSLPGFSYSLVKAFSAQMNLTLVTHIRNQKVLEKSERKLNCEVIYIDNEWLAKPCFHLSEGLKKLGLGGWMTHTATSVIPYIIFERIAYKRLKKRIASGEYQLAIRISPVSPTLPSPFSSLSGLPFVLGPINGGLPWPTGFEEVVKSEGELIRKIRGLYRFFPYYKSTFKNLDLILASFKHVLPDIPEEARNKVIYFDELGVYSDNFVSRGGPEISRKIVFIFVARLVPLKCADVLVEAFSRNDQLKENHLLWIVGDGPERPNLERMIDEKELAHCVELKGWKSQEEVAELMSDSDIFVLPTIREAGGNVILEAMSASLPCIVPCYGGPGTLVDDETGIRVPLVTKEQLICDYECSMLELATNHAKRNSMAQSARRKAVTEFDWNQKGKRLYEICQKVVQNRSTTPSN